MKIACILNWSNSRRTFQREWGKSPKLIMLVSSLILFFNASNVAISLICEKLLMELHSACIVGSKQDIGNPNSEANTCIGIHLWSLPVPALNHNASNNKRLVTLRYKDTTVTITVWRNNNDYVQTNIITKEFDISKHFRVSFFVVAIKTNLLLWLVTRSVASSRFAK